MLFPGLPRHGDVSKDVAVILRTARFERNREIEAERQRVATEDSKAKELKQRTKIFELKRAAAAAEARLLPARGDACRVPVGPRRS